jgi:putative membrane protein
MVHTDSRFSAETEQAIARLERHTDAEVVVVAAERSGSYADVTTLIASIVTLAVLVLLMYLPQSFAPHWIIADLAFVWWLTRQLACGPRLLRRVVSDDRRHRHVEDAAAAEFYREAVHATPNRTGVLIYLSGLEGLVRVVPDLGIEGRVPPGRWATAISEFSHDDLDHFLSGLDCVGELLKEFIPHTEGSDDTDLPNAPRIRS